jgi:hypothetical protein
MNCSEFRDTIDSEFKGDIPDLSLELKQHFDSCSACASHLKGFIELRRVLAHDRLEVLPGELDNINFERIISLVSGKEKKQHARDSVFIAWARWAWIPAAAAAMILMAVLIPRIGTRSDIDYSSALLLYGPTGQQLEDVVASSDSLSREFMSTLLNGAGDIYQAGEELTSGSDINEMLNGLSDTELRTLEERLANLKG